MRRPHMASRTVLTLKHCPRPRRSIQSPNVVLPYNRCQYTDYASLAVDVFIPRNQSPQSSPWDCPLVVSTGTPAGTDDSSRKAGTNHNRSSTTTKKQVPCRFFLQGHCNKGDQCQWNHEYQTVRTWIRF